MGHRENGGWGERLGQVEGGKTAVGMKKNKKCLQILEDHERYEVENR